MKNERDVKEEVKKILNDVGAWWYMPVQTGYGTKGIPDFIACHRGKLVGIETKFGKNTESAWQRKQGAAIREAGGYYYVVRETDLEQLRTALEVRA